MYRNNNGDIVLWLTMMQCQQSLTFRGHSFSREGRKCFTFCFSYKGGQNFIYHCLQPITTQITQDTRPSIVDALLRLTFRMGFGAFLCLFLSLRQPIHQKETATYHVNILRLTLPYLNVMKNSETRNAEPEIGTDRCSQTRHNLWVEGCVPRCGQPSGRGPAISTGLEPNRIVIEVQTSTADSSPDPVANTSQTLCTCTCKCLYCVVATCLARYINTSIVIRILNMVWSGTWFHSPANSLSTFACTDFNTFCFYTICIFWLTHWNA